VYIRSEPLPAYKDTKSSSADTVTLFWQPAPAGVECEVAQVGHELLMTALRIGAREPSL
jgi:hypothetical protein